MKIYLYGVYWYNHFEIGVAKALKKAGCTVKFVCKSELKHRFGYYYYAMFNKRFKKRQDVFLASLEEFILQDITSFQPDFLLVFGGQNLRRSCFQSVKEKLRIPIIAWYVDNPFHFPEVKDSLDLPDQIITHDRAIRDDILKYNNNVTYLPNCTDPELFIQTKNSRLRFGNISFIGHSYGGHSKTGLKRASAINTVADHGVVVYGDRNWKNTYTYFTGLRGRCIDRILTPQECAYIYYNSKINLNINHIQNIDSVTQRTFDIPVAGGFQIVEYAPCIEELFHKQDIVSFKTLDDLWHKTLFYLKHETLRSDIVQRSAAHILQHHTFDNRVQKLLRII
ncbi:MAG: hypothetical protein DKM50_00770 [Candidatus Margulisiibacteriota bacterium]|nr:MAG: hypothetical protein A2X43_07230 [Candidatus Margulisbacteria bacterium GWD2_39_127]PZM83948.1 MAG: hypothetical protein DKM50_00770 [Candidatus Margulisiibacteriota bacterium]HAR62915.1 hypothetical protein [Candidatus Margulisiibacteriota bacterium]HCY37325.1 hypothetical protein [Candidatus Margulisiibacteriota bacterium]